MRGGVKGRLEFFQKIIGFGSRTLPLGLVVDFIVVFYEPSPHSAIGLATLFEFYSSFTLLQIGGDGGGGRGGGGGGEKESKRARGGEKCRKSGSTENGKTLVDLELRLTGNSG